MRKILPISILAILVFLVFSCKKDDIYSRPDWLAGKLFSQIEAKKDTLSTFAEAIRMTGYDSIINTSGSYTVFAPSNDAWDLFFQEHPEYGSLQGIPIEELTRIVKYHIVQNPWSAEQLRQLDVNGWIDTLDADNDEPRGFKRETLLRDKNSNYGVGKSKDPLRVGETRKLIIVDTLQSSWLRRQTTDSRKYAPLFYSEFMDIYDLGSDDFAFYFDRPFESASIYFVNAKIIKPDIFAENGFIHIVDRVVVPLKNAYQIMKESTQNNYSDFLNLINTFPEFNYNDEATKDQPGYDMGLQVDSLFDISYPVLTFGIVNEKTSAPKGTTGLPGNVTIRYQHGIVAPTNAAMADFVSQYITGTAKWGTLDKAPVHVRRMIVNSHMANYSIYPSNFTSGYYNGENDLITIDPSTIIEKKMGSNSSFIGVNEVIVPRAFSSITGPVYLLKGYSRLMYAIERAGLLSALKRANRDYMFFVEKDANLSLDSALMYNPVNERFQIYQVSAGTATPKSTTTADLRNLLMNQVGIRQSTGVPRKEFIETLGGNYLIVNNITGEVRGSAPTTFGYHNSKIVTLQPQLITEGDNGNTYDVANWFNFSAATIYSIISSNYPAFHNLLVSAGLADTRNYRYTFMSEDEFYTVFVPSPDALAAYPVGSLTPDKLKKFLMMHFVQGTLMFTDGNKSAGYYETCRIDEKSTVYTKVFTKVYINPVIDAIEIRADDGSNYLTVSESATSNVMAARVIEPDLTYPTMVTNGVIHQIDNVFDISGMDTE
jgi:uncharacterized surface protein with fasciclin (FAS1) repeats